MPNDPGSDQQPMLRFTKLSEGVGQRAQIDTETVRALLLVHGGGAIAMLTVFRSFLESEKHAQLARPALSGVIIFMIGLFCAIIHNQLRRQCSLIYEHHRMKPPPGKILGRQLKKHPAICFFSLAFMWLSVAAFVWAGIVLGLSGMLAVAK